MDKKTIITIVVAVILVVGGYFLYISLGSGKADVPLTATSGTGAGTAATNADDAKFIAIITNIKNLTIDTSLFQDQVFQKLTDIGVPLVRQPTRNSNPFLPIQGAAAAVSSGVVDVSFPSVSSQQPGGAKKIVPKK